MKSSASSDKKNTKALMRLVMQQVRPYKKWLLIIFAAMILTTLMDIAAPWPLKIIIDNVIDKQPLPAWLAWIQIFSAGNNRMELAAAAAITLVVITIVGAIAGYLNSYFTESTAQYVANDVRLQVYHHLERLSFGYYDTHQIGKILSTITADVSTMQDFVSNTLLSILIDAMTILGILALMFYINWSFALIAVAVTPFLLIFVFRLKRAVKRSVREVRQDESNILAVLQQDLGSIKVIDAFGTQDLEEERLKKASMKTVHAALKARRIKALVSPVVNIIVILCIAIVLWKGSALVMTGFMTIGALTVLLSYLTKFFSPVKDLAKMTNAVAQATVALERIQQLLDTDDIIPEKPGAAEPAEFKGEIIFDDVSFGYNAETTVLKHVYIKISSGQRIGICGQTGCGKSTIASLIPRFYDPACGKILIDGVDITDYKLEGLRKQIGFVLQDTVLFYGSIGENIAYGKPGATAEEIMNAARLANAEEFIIKMPHGYDTQVGERGLTLSGGQRQRIGIARAIIRNSPILILDEPTASLDTESEKIVMEALETLMKGRTVITIAHRLSTIKDSDKIIVIKNGTVMEEGTHEELLTHGKLYAELFHIQTKDIITDLKAVHLFSADKE
jgi:subfamily B ATP-binding cassette protein MsbA